MIAYAGRYGHCPPSEARAMLVSELATFNASIAELLAEEPKTAGIFNDEA